MRTISALVLSIPAAWIASVHGQDYSFINIADSNGPLSGFAVGPNYPGPAINNAGVVAFTATLDAGGRGIYAGNGGSLATIALTGGEFITFAHQPRLNDNGHVVYQAEIDGGYGGCVDSLWVNTGSATNAVVVSNAPCYWSYAPLAINSSNLVGFHIYEAVGWNRLASGYAGGPWGVIYGPGAPAPNPVVQADLNDTPQLAFLSFVDGNFAILRGYGGAATTIADSTGEFSLFHALDLNNLGQVAFWATRDNGSSGVFVGDGAALTTIAESGAGYYGFGPVALNDAGDLAFIASSIPTGGGVGIFTGPNALADKVIVTGDSLFGSTVVDLKFFRGLSNDGRIAFFYQLANETNGVAVAMPIDFCPADINGDSLVNVVDLLAVINAWGSGGGPADVNGDGVVNVGDLLAVINAWGAC